MPPAVERPGHSWRLRTRWVIGLAVLVLASWAFRPLWRGEVPAGRDLVRLFVPGAAVLHDALVAGEVPWWNPREGLGRAFVAELQLQAFYPLRVIPALLLSPWRAVTVEWLLHVLLAGAGVAALCRALRRSKLAAATAGAAFALSPLFTTLSWQHNVLCAAAWSGWLCLAAVALVRRANPIRLALFAAVLALDFLCGSPETLLWQGWVVALVVAFARPGARAVGVLAGGAVLALGLVAQTLLPGLELAGLAQRVGPDEVLHWSLSWPQLAGVLMPTADLPSAPGYYSGDQHFLERVYLGITVALCVLAAPVWKRPNRAFLLGAASLAVVSLGRFLPPVGWLLLHSPLSRFRYPAKAFVGVAFCVAVLASAGMDRWRARRRRGRGSAGARRTGWIVGTFLGALLLIITVLPSSLFRSGLSVGALVAWLWTAITVASLRWTPARHTLRVLAACIWGDLFLAHLLLAPVGWAPLAVLERPSLFAARIREAPGRVSIRTDEPTDADERPVPVTRARDLLVPNTAELEDLEQFEAYAAPVPPGFARFNVTDRAVFDLAGVSWFIRRTRPFEDLEPVAQSGGFRLDRSRTALPRAFVVNRAIPTSDADAARALLSSEQPARHTVFLASGAPVEADPCPENQAERTAAGWNHERFQVRTCRPGYLVESSAFFPGWRAQLDGAEVPVERADLGLRAIPVPPGTHRLELTYRPASVRLGVLLSWASLAVWCALVAAGLLAARRPDRHRVQVSSV